MENNNISLRKGRWTKSEVEILLKNYKSKTCKELARILNRPEQAIYHKLILLGISSSDIESRREGYTSTRKPRSKALGMRHWTPDEDKFLVENYKTMTYIEIGKILNRTEKSVSIRCNTLKLSKNCINIKSLTSSDIDNICKLAYQGKTKKEVYEQYNINKQTFNSLIARHDIKFESLMIDDNIKDAILKHSNMKTSELAERYGVSIASVLKILDRHPGKNWNKLSDDDKRYIFRNPDNLSVEELQSKFKLSNQDFNKYTGRYIPKEIRLFLIDNKDASTDDLCSIFNISKRTAQSYKSVFKVNDISSLEDFPDHDSMPELNKGTKKYKSKMKKIKAKYNEKDPEGYYSSDKDYVKKYNFVRSHRLTNSENYILKKLNISRDEFTSILVDMYNHDHKRLIFKQD